MKSVETLGGRSFGQPENWDERLDGKCYALSVRVELHGERNLIKLTSTWRPSRAELALLNIGGEIELSILSQVQPPVSLTVVPPPASVIPFSRPPALTINEDAHGLGYDDHGPSTP